MNWNASFKYQAAEIKRPAAIFYFVVLCVTIFMFIIAFMNSDSIGAAQYQGYEISTAIFVFVLGLCSFKESFGMLLQNGISRKTMFLSKMLVFPVWCLLFAVIDRLFILLGSWLTSLNEKIIYTGLQSQMYPQHVQEIGGFRQFAEGILFNFCMYMAFAAIGFFITILFYRMNKGGKIAVSIGIPALALFVLPVVDGYLFQGAVFRKLAQFLDFSLGLSAQNPFAAMMTGFLCFLIFGGLSYAAMRKAVVKN